MAEFNVLEFCKEPKVELLSSKTVTKDNWKFIATCFKIPYRSDATKIQIQNLVLDQLVEQGYLPSSALALKELGVSKDTTSLVSDCDEGDIDLEDFHEQLTAGQVQVKLKALEDKKAQREWDRENFKMLQEAEREKFERDKARLGMEQETLKMKIRLEEMYTQKLKSESPEDLLRQFDVAKKCTVSREF